MLRGPAVVPSYVGRALHATHAVATLVLLATGLLLEFPELRSLAIDGYGQPIITIHLVVGGAFALLPLVALGIARAALVEGLRRRLAPPEPWRGRKSHIAAFLVVVALLFASGAVMWAGASFRSRPGTPPAWCTSSSPRASGSLCWSIS